MYHQPTGFRERDVSMRLIKPTLPEIYVDEVVYLVKNWDPNWEIDGEITIYDEGIAQYLLTDMNSHLKFYAALILGKPSMRCKIVKEEPEDILDMEAENNFKLISQKQLTPESVKSIEFLKQALSRRGFRFPT
uniref:Uncharacterized protein n=1 Tax=Acrobeloides nanus TaxID=290746 RepID=A0A914C4P8_9BILA